MEQMFEIVSRVDLYPEFVPYCREGRVYAKRPGHFKASMAIGFPPIMERYTSVITVARPHLVRVSSL